MKIKLGVSLLLAFLAFIFIAQNAETVTVDFLFWSSGMSLVLLLFIMLFTGMIIGWILNSALRFSRNRRKAAGAVPSTTQPRAAGKTAQGDRHPHE